MNRISILALIVFAVACNSANTTNTKGTSMQGMWTVTGTFQNGSSSVSSTYQVAFVSSPCTVTTSVGMFSVKGSVCFIANNNTGEGSISGLGIPVSPQGAGQGVLIGVPSNPVPTNTTANLLFVAGDKNGNVVEFTGSGNVADGQMTGTASCSQNTPICQGATATFSGKQQ